MYLGAFFIIVAGSIFVSYSYASLSGIFKTALVAITATAFYVSGLYFYTQTKKIKPAGLTFTSIGLLLYPLVGLALYNFVLNGQNGKLLWFITSVICLGLYVFSIRLLKKAYLSYLVSFSALSLIESTLYLFNVPIHYMSWGMTLTGMLFVIINRYFHLENDYATPAQRMSQIYVIFSFIYSVLFAPTHGWIQAGGNIFLIGLYCDMLSLMTTNESDKKTYFFTSLMLFPIGLYLAFGGYIHEFRGLYGCAPVAIIGAGYLSLMEIYTQHKIDWRARLLGLSSGIVILASSFVAYGNSLLVLLLLALSAGVNLYIPRRINQNYNTYLGIFSLILLPYVLLHMVITPATSAELTALAYIALAAGLMQLRVITPNITDIRKISIISYSISIAIAILWLFLATQLYSILICILCLTFIVGISYTDNLPDAVMLAIAISYLYAFKVFNLLQMYPTSYQPYIVFAVGICWYGLSFYLKNRQQKYMRIGGVVGSYVSAYVVASNNITALHGSLLLGVGAAQTYVEGLLNTNRNLKYISAGVGIVAIQWFLRSVLLIEELQVYTIMYAAYFAGIAYFEYKHGEKKNIDALIIISMAILTMPLGYQALSSQVKGLMLIAEGLLLVLAGIGLKLKNVLYWGIGVLIIEVFYQLRGFILGLPSWVIFGIIGLLLLSGSIALLSRRKE
jgi:hypothetical protein